MSRRREAVREAVEKVEHDLFGTFDLMKRLARAVDMVISPEPAPPPVAREPKKVVVNARVVRQEGSTIEVSSTPMPPRRSGDGR
jgi:hypothetical protein